MGSYGVAGRYFEWVMYWMGSRDFLFDLKKIEWLSITWVIE